MSVKRVQLARSRAVAGVAAALVLAGCTAVVDGAPHRAAGGPAPGTADPALLDPGNYPRKPLPPMGVAGTPEVGALFDARRMGDFVVGAWEVDPTLVDQWGLPMGRGVAPLGPDGLPTVLPEAKDPAAASNLVNIFAAGRQAPKSKQLLNAVLRMTDPPAAAAAMDTFVQAVQQDPPNSGEVISPIPVPEHPEAQALTSSYTGIDGTHWVGLQAFTAHGPYVLYQAAYTVDNPTTAPAMVAKMLDLQAPRIDGFAPTDPAQFATLPRDPSGVLAKALPVAPGQSDVSNKATFGGYAMLHYQENPIVSNAVHVFPDAGVDVGVHGYSWVIRARDGAGAAAVADAAFGQLTASPADPVPNLPGSRCLNFVEKKYFWCVATSDRYEFEVSGTQLRDVHQQAAAQYLLLTTT